MGRSRQQDRPLVDGVYDPSYRSAKLEHYARLGFARSRRVIKDFLAGTTASELVYERERAADRLLRMLVDARCIALVSAGVDEENEEDARQRDKRRT